MESLSLEENISKDIRNLFRLRKDLNYIAIKDTRNHFRLKKETKAIKSRTTKRIKNLSEHEEEEKFYKPVAVSNPWSNIYIECKQNHDKIKHYQWKIILIKSDLI